MASNPNRPAGRSFFAALWGGLSKSTAGSGSPGAVFRDAEDGPEMVVIPPGRFLMGSPEGEAGRYTGESPMHEVTIAYSFAVAKYPVTRGEWRRYLAESGRTGRSGAWARNPTTRQWERKQEYSWSWPGYAQEDSHPVVCVSWTEANQYAVWLSDKTGHHYRLLSEAEYEYIQRAGSQTAYFWGDTADAMSLYTQKRSRDGELQGTWPVGRFKANALGLHDTTGHVWCWTRDPWHESYQGAPADGSARQSGAPDVYSVRGGSWEDAPRDLRSASRFNGNDVACILVGFRVARSA